MSLQTIKRVLSDHSIRFRERGESLEAYCDIAGWIDVTDWNGVVLLTWLGY